jgi:hypothetical protein
VEKGEAAPVFFVGDSFTPSGIDDYCALNRNLLHEGSGYLLCFDKLRAEEAGLWLMNQHVSQVFTFSRQELDYLERRYRGRIALLRELFPWDDPNYGVDEQWAVIYPRGAGLRRGETGDFELRITNHSPRRRRFAVTLHARNLAFSERELTLVLPARQSGAVKFCVRAEGEKGHDLITADIRSEGMEFCEWVEASVAVD